MKIYVDLGVNVSAIDEIYFTMVQRCQFEYGMNSFMRMWKKISDVKNSNRPWVFGEVYT